METNKHTEQEPRVTWWERRGLPNCSSEPDRRVGWFTRRQAGGKNQTKAGKFPGECEVNSVDSWEVGESED